MPPANEFRERVVVQLTTHQSEIAALKEAVREVERKYDRLFWSMLTGCVLLIIQLILFIATLMKIKS